MEQPRFNERLTVPLRWWVLGTMLVASLWVALIVAVPEVWAFGIATAALVLMGALFVYYGSARIRVVDDALHVGRAHIDLQFLGAVELLEKERMRLAAGLDADPRAFLLLRPYLARGIRVTLTDPQDPAPYWLFHTRRGSDLAKALSTSARG